MATTNASAAAALKRARAMRSRAIHLADLLGAGRPMIALVAILLTTGGHTMNLRELGVSQGWVPAEVYTLQSSYLVSLALTMLACPALAQRRSCRELARWGLVLAMVGGFVNTLEWRASLSIFLAGRIVAGAGAGMVIYFAPRLLDPRWRLSVAWAAILCPVIGPGIVAMATMFYETSDWRHGFMFEMALAAVGLVALLSMDRTPEARPRATHGSLAYLPGLVVMSAALLYGLHYGQLQGWLESPDIQAALTIGAVALTISIWTARPQVSWKALRENWVRLALFFVGGMCQFFHGYLMNVYGGMIVNLSSWQRVWLIWPLPVGVGLALAASRIRWRHIRLIRGLSGAIAGLSLLTIGFFLCYMEMMEWPYWDFRAVMDLNWFPAPGHWQLAPGRFTMGLGIGLFMVAMDLEASPSPRREDMVRPFLQVAQFYGGGLAAAVLINFLIIGHKVHYSYSAERSAIQAEEFQQREEAIGRRLEQAGQPAPKRSAEVLLYRFINFEADNLVFATIYITFAFATLGLTGFFLAVWIRRLLGEVTHVPPPRRAPKPRAKRRRRVGQSSGAAR